MDEGRLTPYLRRRVLALTPGDRATLMREIGESLGDPSYRNTAARFGRMAELMGTITGVDVRRRTRRSDVVRARSVLAFVAVTEGFSQIAVSRYLGFDHSTISVMVKKMGDAMNYPAMYQDYISLYNEYKEQLKQSA